MADGVTTLYQDGTEYGTTSGQDIFPTWNWTRLPGTTLEQLTDAQVISLSTTNASNLSANVGRVRLSEACPTGRTALQPWTMEERSAASPPKRLLLL